MGIDKIPAQLEQYEISRVKFEKIHVDVSIEARKIFLIFAERVYKDAKVGVAQAGI